MKKIIALVVSGCLCLCMFGCGGSSSPATAPEETTQSQEQGASDSETNENSRKQKPSARHPRQLVKLKTLSVTGQDRLKCIWNTMKVLLKRFSP